MTSFVPENAVARFEIPVAARGCTVMSPIVTVPAERFVYCLGPELRMSE